MAKQVKKSNMALKRPTAALGAIVGTKPMARLAIVSALWDYIRKHKLQNPEARREIVCDTKFKAAFGVERMSMFEMNKLLSGLLT